MRQGNHYTRVIKTLLIMLYVLWEDSLVIVARTTMRKNAVKRG